MDTASYASLSMYVCIPRVQVAIGKMFEMFIVHDHHDLQIMKVQLERRMSRDILWMPGVSRAHNSASHRSGGLA